MWSWEIHVHLIGLLLVCSTHGPPMIGQQYSVLLGILMIAKWDKVIQIAVTSYSRPEIPGEVLNIIPNIKMLSIEEINDLMSLSYTTLSIQWIISVRFWAEQENLKLREGGWQSMEDQDVMVSSICMKGIVGRLALQLHLNLWIATHGEQ